MHNAVAMRSIESIRRLLEPGECLRRRLCAAVAQLLLERTTREVLHDDERTVALLADVVDRDDVRIAGETRDRKRFAREALPHRRVLRIPVVEHLDRDRTT